MERIIAQQQRDGCIMHGHTNSEDKGQVLPPPESGSVSPEFQGIPSTPVHVNSNSCQHYYLKVPYSIII